MLPSSGNGMLWGGVWIRECKFTPEGIFQTRVYGFGRL